MKNKKMRRRYINYSIAAIVFTLICFDFVASSEKYTAEGTYRLESEFVDAVSSATPKVSIVPSDYSELSKSVSRTSDPSFDHIQEMVDKAIELQGGFGGIISNGNTVMIKVNLVGGNSPSGEGENTDVRVVKALIKNINTYTGGDVKILVAEGTARTNDDPVKSGSVWDNSGYKDLLSDSYLSGIDFSLLNLNQGVDNLMEIDLKSKGTSAPQGTVYSVHEEEVKADVYITVPVLKIHDTGITNALKLQVGSAPGCHYGYNKMSGTSRSTGLYHDVDHRRWTTEMIVDLCKVADIDFVLVDAIMCLESYKTYKGNNQVRMNTVIAGVDPVAVDHVCTKLLGLNPDDIAHITLAEKVGLGTNNADNIYVVGAEIADVAKRVDKNSSTNGVWGQSNRTWLLSKDYAASKVTTAGINGEASYIPKSGVDSWSEPVYFFDDRIDLGSYFGGKTDINTYAFTYFSSPEAQKAELWLGSHEGIIVYINGAEVYSSTSTNVYSSSDIGDEVAIIDLLKGENTLMVKTFNSFGDYSFALNICEKTTNNDINGNRVEGLKFYITEPQVGISKANNQNAYSVNVYPNPCVSYANISVEVPKEMVGSVDVYDINGRFVKNINKGTFTSGENTFTWSLRSQNGSQVNSGIYLCVLSSGKYQTTSRIVVE